MQWSLSDIVYYSFKKMIFHIFVEAYQDRINRIFVIFRSSHPEVLLGKGVLKKCSKFTVEHPCWSVICNFIEMTLQHGCSPVNLLHIFRIPFLKNTSGRLLLNFRYIPNGKMWFYKEQIFWKKKKNSDK